VVCHAVEQFLDHAPDRFQQVSKFSESKKTKSLLTKQHTVGVIQQAQIKLKEINKQILLCTSSCRRVSGRKWMFVFRV